MLTKTEMRLFAEKTARMVGWLTLAQRRLSNRGEIGEIADKTEAAIRAISALRMAAHYESCSGAGVRNEREP